MNLISILLVCLCFSIISASEFRSSSESSSSDWWRRCKCTPYGRGQDVAIGLDYPYPRNNVQVTGASGVQRRMNYIDVGSGPRTFVLIHGQPSNSYLWRNVIPHLMWEGRVLAPDLIGYGRSSKTMDNYTFGEWYSYFESFVVTLGLTDITPVIHDWGGGFGIIYASRFPDNIHSMVFFENVMPIYPPYEQAPDSFRAFVDNVQGPVGGDAYNRIVFQLGFFDIFRDIMPDATDGLICRYSQPYFKGNFRKREMMYWVAQWIPMPEIPGGRPNQGAESLGLLNIGFNWLINTQVPLLAFGCPTGFILPYGAPDIPGTLLWLKTVFGLDTLTTIPTPGDCTHFIQESYPHFLGTEIAKWVRDL